MSTGSDPPAEHGRASVVGVVLAGGQSARMGRDKALIRVPSPDGPTPMAARVAAALAPWCAAVVIVRRAGDPPVPGAFDTLWEAPGPRHPLRGIATAAAAFPGMDLLFAPCDLPELTADDLAPLASQTEGVAWDGDRHALVARVSAARAQTAGGWADAGGAAWGWLAPLVRVRLPARALRDADTPDALPGADRQAT